MMFVMVTGDHLVLGIRRFAIYRIIILILTAPVTVTMHFLRQYLQYWQIPCYILSYLVMGATLCIYSTMFRSLLRAAMLLNNCFKVRNSRNFMYEGNSQHSGRFCSLILIVIIFPWKVTLFNCFFCQHDRLRSAFK